MHHYKMNKKLTDKEIEAIYRDEISHSDDSVVDVVPHFIPEGGVIYEREEIASDGETEQIENSLPNSNTYLPGTSNFSRYRTIPARRSRDTQEQNVFWSNMKHIFITPPEEFQQFEGPCQIILDIEDPNPIEIFMKFFPYNLIEHILFQTNLYATQSGKKFIPSTVEEIKTFWGIKKLPSYRDYWSSSLDLHDPYISTLMKVNRFGWLLSNLHLNDNVVQPSRDNANFDKLYKVRPLLNILSKTFKECYNPGKIVAVDKSMIKFKGRSGMKQYLKDKPIKRGYKV